MHICIYIKGHLVKGRVVLIEEMISLNRDELLLRKINTVQSYENCFKRGRVGSRKEESYQNSGV